MTRGRTDPYQLDLIRYELRRANGVRVKLERQPMELLILLVERKGQLVTREEVASRLWRDGIFVDTEPAINNAIRKIRAALHDSPDRPVHLETVVGKGYRFIGDLEVIGAESVPDIAEPPSAAPASARRQWFRIWPMLAGVAVLLAAGTLAWRAPWRSRGSPSDVQIKSLAVLPLENLSGDPAQDYFSDGITDELITALAKISSIKVISRTSVMQYKGVHNKPLPQIARELGVNAVLEGTLVRSGDWVRVTTQLIEAATDRHIWTDRYERSSRDILLVESEIARAVVEQLRGKLNPQEQRRLRANPIDSAAHEAYLQGLYLWNRRTPRALQEAVRYFTQAIEKEPRYPAAYAGRAGAYIVLGSGAMEAIPPEEAFTKARADADQALQLDETNVEAHAARGAIRHIYEWDSPGAEPEYQRAIELGPNNATARFWYGQYLCNLGRFEQCIAETARAHALDPANLAVAVDVGFRLYEARRYAEAIAPIQKVLEFNPDFAVGQRCLGQVYEANRMYREAVPELQRAVELSGEVPMYVAALGHAHAVSGHLAEARKALQKLDELATRRYVSNFPRALISAGLGENDRTLEFLERAFQEHSTGMVKLKVDPRLDSLRQDARFTNLLRRVGLTP
jgi:TolB-like protein/DNA-binding winged helix-turn-helix (wHTH) protein/Flp pilus assembly protein TadD